MLNRSLFKHRFREASPFLKRGFTLIEMMVVMAVVALLLSIAVPRYFGSLERSKEAALRQNLAVVRDVLDKFYTDQGRYPENLDELVEKKYLRALPVDPLTESDKTWIQVPSQDQSIKGISDIRSGAEGSAIDGVPFEQW